MEVPADRFAREIVGFSYTCWGVLAAADGQAVGRRHVCTSYDPHNCSIVVHYARCSREIELKEEEDELPNGTCDDVV